MSNGIDVRCVVCGGHVKSINHIFVLGEIASVIWYRMFRWVGGPDLSRGRFLVVF